MKRGKWWIAGATGALVALGATTLPAQAATTGYTRLDCYAAGSSKRAALEVNMTFVKGQSWRITGSKYNTVNPAFRAEKVQVMLQPGGAGAFHTLNTWGDGSKDSVGPSGTSNVTNWDDSAPPYVIPGQDNLKLKISEASASMDCPVRTVGWHS